ncbi:hypothetical protein P9112_004629 [Eukaryota sp. TZLM1-RC]
MTASKFPSVIWITGKAAIGKGTMSEFLLDRFSSFAHISVGDILRHETKDPESPFAQQLQQILGAGQIVPSSLAMPILRRWILKKADEGFKCIVIDGFPRALDQALMYEQEMGLPAVLLHFDAPDSVCLARTLNRAKEAIANGENPRSDDNEEKFAIRLEAFNSTTLPVIQHYQKDHPDVYACVDCNASREEVFERVLDVLKQRHSLSKCLI